MCKRCFCFPLMYVTATIRRGEEVATQRCLMYWGNSIGLVSWMPEQLFQGVTFHAVKKALALQQNIYIYMYMNIYIYIYMYKYCLYR